MFNDSEYLQTFRLELFFFWSSNLLFTNFRFLLPLPSLPRCEVIGPLRGSTELLAPSLPKMEKLKLKEKMKLCSLYHMNVKFDFSN